MSIHNLERIFKPKSLAIVGASERPGSIGNSVMKNIVDGGYKGEIFPVNPKHKTICGLKAFASVLDLSKKEGIGFSHFVSIGSMLDVDFGDLINYLGDDPGVKSIVLYIESLTNVRKFMSAARAISRVKPIVILKSGRSRAGAAAAS